MLFFSEAALEPPCVRSKFGCCWEGTIAKNHVGSHDDGCPGMEKKIIITIWVVSSGLLFHYTFIYPIKID